MHRQRLETGTAAHDLCDATTAAAAGTVEPARVLEDVRLARVGVGAGEGDVLGVCAEKRALEGAGEARGERVGVGGGGEEDESEGVGAVGWGAAFEDKGVAAVEKGRGLGVDFPAGEEEGGDVGVALRGCGVVVCVLCLVADVLLASGVRAWFGGRVLPLPYHFVGADEHEAVDFASQFEGDGDEASGVRGAVFTTRCGVLLCGAGVVDEAEFDIHAAAAGLVRRSASVR